MEIKDVAFVALADTSKNVLLSYNHESFDSRDLLSSIDDETGQVFLFRDRTIFVSRMGSILIVLASFPESNEIFVSKAFGAFIAALNEIIKNNWTVERVAEKYDLLQLLLNEFVFKGIILTDEASVLSSRMIKRTFESMNAIKVNKGFASMLNKATKSFRR